MIRKLADLKFGQEIREEGRRRIRKNAARRRWAAF